MRKRFVCGITVYHPDNAVLERVKDYSALFEKVYVFDNTEVDAVDVEWGNVVKDICNVQYIYEGDNKGLPYAFNRIIESIPADIDFLCTLDQDSVFPTEDILSMKEKLSGLDDNLMAGIVGPKVLYDTNAYVKSDEIVGTRYVITSGSFVNLKAMHKLGIKYDEAYFIDKFEIDLGEQFKLKGYKIYQFLGSVLHQRLGELDSKGRRNHSALRHYYLFRNRFYFNCKFMSAPKRFVITTLQVVKHIGIVVFNEEDKKKKLRMMYVAYVDHRNKRYGKMEK